jgi:ferredoxin-NADP reductase
MDRPGRDGQRIACLDRPRSLPFDLVSSSLSRTYLHSRLTVGDQLDIAAPRGTFMLDRSDAPALLISAGIGATPVLAMLHALAQAHSDREIWWLHGARSGRDDCFAAETRTVLASLPNVRTVVFYSRPDPKDLEGRDFDSAGRLTASRLAQLHPPRGAEAYLCGPAHFMEEISAGLAAMGIDAASIHTEPFGPAPGLTPGIAATAARTPPGRQTWKRPNDRVRPQRPRHPMEQRLRQPARSCRSV